jgi:hypothetical protein
MESIHLEPDISYQLPMSPSHPPLAGPEDVPPAKLRTRSGANKSSVAHLSLELEREVEEFETLRMTVALQFCTRGCG